MTGPTDRRDANWMRFKALAIGAVIAFLLVLIGADVYINDGPLMPLAVAAMGGLLTGAATGWRLLRWRRQGWGDDTPPVSVAFARLADLPVVGLLVGQAFGLWVVRGNGWAATITVPWLGAAFVGVLLYFAARMPDQLLASAQSSYTASRPQSGRLFAVLSITGMLGIVTLLVYAAVINLLLR